MRRTRRSRSSGRSPKAAWGLNRRSSPKVSGSSAGGGGASATGGSGGGASFTAQPASRARIETRARNRASEKERMTFSGKPGPRGPFNPPLRATATPCAMQPRTPLRATRNAENTNAVKKYRAAMRPGRKSADRRTPEPAAMEWEPLPDENRHCATKGECGRPAGPADRDCLSIGGKTAATKGKSDRAYGAPHRKRPTRLPPRRPPSSPPTPRPYPCAARASRPRRVWSRPRPG